MGGVPVSLSEERALSGRDGPQRERALSERDGPQRERGAKRAGAPAGPAEERV